MKAFVDGAGVDGSFELELVFGGEDLGDVNLNREAGDPAWRGGGHLFFDGCGGAGDVEREGAGHDAHDAQHAGAEGGGDEIGGGEAFAAALVVRWGVGDEGGGGGGMDCPAVQVPQVFELDGDHC